MIINTSDYFRLRPDQREMFREFFGTNKKRFVWILHRRFGKDFVSFNLTWLAALTKPGLYLYLLPKISQARSVIWDGRGKDGIRLRDRIPPMLVQSMNETRMSITLANGSIIHFTGGDNYEAILGSNPLGVVLSEYQSMDPLAWELFLRAILAENGGWAIFISTPRGHNHLYELYETNKNNPKWHTLIKTVEDTKLEDGSPVVPISVVEAERAGGMEESLVQQEFYCSFEAAIRGAFFGEHMKTMKNEGRIRTFKVEPKARVYTAIDIGVRDPTAAWFLQIVNGEWRLIYYLEQTDKDLAYFIQKLKDVKELLGFEKYAFHFVPHDIAVREWGSGKSRLALAREMGVILTPVNKIGSQQIRIIEGISIVRHNMARMHIHKSNCRRGIRALTEYHALYDEEKKVYLGPRHDWSSHAASAMATLCIGFMIQYENPQLLRLRNYARYIPCA